MTISKSKSKSNAEASRSCPPSSQAHLVLHVADDVVVVVLELAGARHAQRGAVQLEGHVGVGHACDGEVVACSWVRAPQLKIVCPN